MIETDVLVVGAGPAGSTAAKHAALGGAEVIIIDKKSEIGVPKRCAEGVTKKGLKKLGIKPDPRFIANEINETRFIAPDGTAVNVAVDEIELLQIGYILERKVFDKFMAMDAARAGAEIRIKTLATGLEKNDDGFVVSCESMGRTFDIKAKIIIAADGPESHIGRWAGLNTATKAVKMESGIQYEMCNLHLERDDIIEFYIGSRVPGGYIWVFPKGEDIANVGLAILSSKADKRAIEYLDDFIATSPVTRDAQSVEMNVGGDPVGGIPKKISGERIMVVGDAAGMVNPLTGEGIITGMTGGMYAGQVAGEAVKNGDFSARFLKKYDKLVRDDFGEDFKKYLIVQEALLGLGDEELNQIVHEFQNLDLSDVSTIQLAKTLIKVSPKTALKLGKAIF